MCLPFYQKDCCGGSFICCNESFNIRKCYGEENQLQFNKSKNSYSVCGNPGEFIPFLTVNLWEFDDSAGKKLSAMMARQGSETRKLFVLSEGVNKKLTSGTTVTRSTEDAIIDLLKKDELCLDNIYKIAVSTLEKDMLYYATRKANAAQSDPHKHSFDTLSLTRTKLLEKDLFFIYHLNDRNMNGKTSFVFKISRTHTNLACAMTCDGTSFLNTEYCFANGAFK